MQLFLINECLFVCSKKISGNLGGSETMQVVAFCFFYNGTGSIIRLHISLLMQTLKILPFLERLMIIRSVLLFLVKLMKQTDLIAVSFQLQRPNDFKSIISLKPVLSRFLYALIPCIMFVGVQIAYSVWVQMEEGCGYQDAQGLSPEMRQRSTVGAVKVAVRSSSMGAGPSKS